MWKYIRPIFMGLDAFLKEKLDNQDRALSPQGRTGAIKAGKIDPKQILRIQSKLDAIMRPIAQQVIADINDGKCIKEMGLWCVVESRVATAGMLMHKNQLGRDNRARERGPHRSQEKVKILKELATLIAARTTRGRPGRASAALQQCMTQFVLDSIFTMTPQKVNRVAKLPEWSTVLEVIIESRRADLAFRTTKQERWNQRAKDTQPHKDSWKSIEALASFQVGMHHNLSKQK